VGLLGGLGGSMTGLYVHTTGRDCTAQFEGVLPSVVVPKRLTLYGMGPCRYR
jgi:hypothetical protein